jgi:hypothetical protein
MFEPQKIPLFRVKQAYGLDNYEPQELLDYLSPDGVFPYELWQKAYSSYWKYPAAECSRLYKVENPSFPETHQIPEKNFPTETYAKWMVDFFFDMARRISAEALEKGFDYIVETTYDDKFAVSESDRDYIFYPLKLVDKNISTITRLEGVKNIDIYTSSGVVLLKIFPDTVSVNNLSSIHYWSVIRGFPFVKKVKGITEKIVEFVIKRATQKMSPVLDPEPSRIITEPQSPSALEQEAPLNTLPEVTEHGQQEGMILIPRSLWEGKKPQQVCNDMRVAGYDDTPITYALYYWVGVKNYTKIGTILRGEDISESARDKHARKHLKLAEGRYYTE